MDAPPQSPDAGADQKPSQLELDLMAAIAPAREGVSALGAGFGARSPQIGVVAVGDGADVPNGRRIRPSDRHQIGSTTKTFTAVAIVQLVESGQLSIDSPISTWYPQVPGATEITVRNLLQHRSGLPQEDPNSDLYTPQTEEAFIASLQRRGLLYPAGSEFLYNNNNYTLLGLIIERVTGKDYDVVIRDGIIEPLGMNDTYLEGFEILEGGHLSGFFWSSLDQLEQFLEFDPTWTWSAGGIISTTTDMTRFMEGVFTGEILSDAGVAMLLDGLTDPTDPGAIYGLGISVNQTAWGTMYYHAGAVNGFISMAGYLPDRQLAFSTFVNTWLIPEAPITEAALDVITGN